MKKVLLNVTNHELTQEQIACFNHVENLPDNLKKLWSAIPPEADRDEVHEYIYQIIDWVFNASTKYKDAYVYVAVAGDLCATLIVLDVIKSVVETSQCRIIPVQATTRRVSVEETAADGSVIKKSIFKFIRWREL